MTREKNETCAVVGCTKAPRGRMCSMHWQRKYKRDDTHYIWIPPKPRGHLTKCGYRAFSVRSGGKKRLRQEHVLIVERVLGKPLPKGAEVHHVDENRDNNANTNLVICPSRAYHMLIHQRMRAMKACGHPNWRKCWLCGRHDDPECMVITTKKSYHRQCSNDYQRVRRSKKHSKELAT